MSKTRLDDALRYHALGWSLLPMKAGGKEPACRWRKFQTLRASEAELRRWFAQADRGIAVIFGTVSGELASRDFDELPAYERWAADHANLAATLPTVFTRRGRHVYFRAEPHVVASLRSTLGKPKGRGAIDCGDGELRVGTGCYSVLPPSRHPSGHTYQWQRPPFDAELPILDVLASGFIPSACFTQPPQATTAIPSHLTPCLVGLSVEECQTVERAIAATLPKKAGERNNLLGPFVRKLKVVPALRDKKASEHRGIVREWHRRALPRISTKEFTETWAEFCRAWHNIRFAEGENPLTICKELADKEPLPVCAAQYDSVPVQRLVALCAQLAKLNGDGTFYLSTRDAGEFMGLTAPRASTYFTMLEDDGILECIERGSHATGKASCFRYLGD